MAFGDQFEEVWVLMRDEAGQYGCTSPIASTRITLTHSELDARI